MRDAGGPAFPDARVLLERHGLRAKKHFGQNFLTSERVFRAIVDATVRADDDWIVEIGAGLGTLTARLAERVPEGKVIALERDPDMVAVLRGELGEVENVQVEPADAMRYDLAMAARWRGDRIVVCGNLPYHIASQLMFRVVEARAHVRRAVSVPRPAPISTIQSSSARTVASTIARNARSEIRKFWPNDFFARSP